MTAQQYYEEENKKGQTENITSNPWPDYRLAFYQEIFELMEGYSEPSNKDLQENLVHMTAWKDALSQRITEDCGFCTTGIDASGEACKACNPYRYKPSK